MYYFFNFSTKITVSHQSFSYSGIEIERIFTGIALSYLCNYIKNLRGKQKTLRSSLKKGYCQHTRLYIYRCILSFFEAYVLISFLPYIYLYIERNLQEIKYRYKLLNDHASSFGCDVV